MLASRMQIAGVIPGVVVSHDVGRLSLRAPSPRQLRLRSLSTEHREFMAQHQDLALLRATRPRRQPDEREQIPYADT